MCLGSYKTQSINYKADAPDFLREFQNTLLCAVSAFGITHLRDWENWNWSVFFEFFFSCSLSPSASYIFLTEERASGLGRKQKCSWHHILSPNKTNTTSFCCLTGFFTIQKVSKFPPFVYFLTPHPVSPEFLSPGLGLIYQHLETDITALQWAKSQTLFRLHRFSH